jgi:hypothetical protein
MENKYKILVHGNSFVDFGMLSKGIYSTLIPTLRDNDTTLESLINDYVVDSIFFSQQQKVQFITNLSQCKLITVTLYIDGE